MNKQVLDIFSFKNPISFLKHYLAKLPREHSRGEHKRLAEAMGIAPSYLSLLLREERYFNSEQASKLSKYLSLSRDETRYLLRLIELQKAQSKDLREILEEEILELRQKSNQIAARVPHETVSLSEAVMARYYADWLPAALSLIVAIPGYQQAPQIAQRLGIPLKRCLDVLGFLVAHGLCKKEGNVYGLGPMHIHLEAGSPFIPMHHNVWRRKAMERHPHLNLDKELAYSVAGCISREDAQKVRALLLDLSKQVRNIYDPSPSETIFQFNMDWFEI